MRERRRGSILEHYQLWLAPVGSLLLLLTPFLLIRPKSGVDHCPCGAELGPQFAPFVRGPDELPRAPFLTWSHHDEKRVMLDVDVVSSSDGLVDGDRLAGALAVRRHQWSVTHPGQTYPAGVIVRAPRQMKATGLLGALSALCRAGTSRVFLATRPLDAHYYRGIALELDCLGARGSLHLDDFATVDELARRTASLRAGKARVAISLETTVPHFARGARAASAR